MESGQAAENVFLTSSNFQHVLTISNHSNPGWVHLQQLLPQFFQVLWWQQFLSRRDMQRPLDTSTYWNHVEPC